MLAARITLPDFSVSSAMNFPKSAGEPGNAAQYPGVTQLIWLDLLAFIWDRLRTYRNQKTQADQWDPQGRKIKRLADASGDPQTFADEALRLMGVRHSRPS
jgi:hypothetical protein